MDKWTDEWAKAAQGMAHHDCWFLLLFSMTIFQLHGIYIIHKYEQSSMSDIESERHQQQYKKHSYKKYTARIEIIPRHIIIISMHIKYKKHSAIEMILDAYFIEPPLCFSLSLYLIHGLSCWIDIARLLRAPSIDENSVRTVYSKCDTTSLTAHKTRKRLNVLPSSQIASILIMWQCKQGIEIQWDSVENNHIAIHICILLSYTKWKRREKEKENSLTCILYICV